MHLKPVNQKLLKQLKPEEVEVDIVRAEVTEDLDEAGIEESELDEMWSYVSKKRQNLILNKRYNALVHAKILEVR